MGIIKAAKELGLNVPRDLSVVGIDDIEWSTHHEPALTTVRIPRQALAETAVSIIQKLFRNNTLERKEVRIPTELIVRESTSAART
jgi:LacI family transcriptional regulator